MINRYFNPVPYEGQLYAPPLQYVTAALESAQKRYDTNFAASEALKNKYIDALPQDRARANELQNQIGAKIDSIVAKYSGDYSAATKDLYSLKSELDRQFRPGSEGYAIQQSYLNYNNSLAKEKERLAKGEITQEQYSSLVNNLDKTYTGVKADPTTGAFNPLQVEPLATYVDTNEIVNNTLKDLKQREVTRVREVRNPKTGMIELITETQSGIDPSEAYTASANAILSDDKFRAYWSQINRLNGTDAEAELQNMLSSYLTNTLPSRTGLFKDEQKLDLREDPIVRDARLYNRQRKIEELRFRNKIRFEEYKAQADQQASYDGSDLAVLGTAKTQFSPLKPLDFNLMAPSGKMVGTIAGVRPEMKKIGVDELIKLRSEPNVNYKLLESLRAGNPTMSSDDVIRLYNENIKNGMNYGEDVYYTRYNTSKAQLEEAKRIVPAALTGQVPIYEFDPKSGEIRAVEEADKRIKIAKNWADEKGNVTARAIGKSSMQTGHLPFGAVMSDNSGKYYVVADPSVKFNQVNFGSGRGKSLRERAFGYTSAPDQNYGAPFELQLDNGSSAEVMWVKDYIYDPASRQSIPQIRYYGVQRGPGGEAFTPNLEDPLVVDGRLATPNDVENLIVPPSELIKTFPRNPRSASKEEDVSLETY